MVNQQDGRSPEDKAWYLGVWLAANLPLPKPDTEYSTKDPQWIRHAKLEMEALAQLRRAIEDNPAALLDAIEIIQEGIRLNFFPTKGERRQLAEPRKTPEEFRAMMDEFAAREERSQRFWMQKAGPHAAVAHGMGAAAKSR